MATLTRNRRVLLTPKMKRDKWQRELELGYKITADGVPKLDEKGKKIRLKEAEKGFRTGYLACQNESAAIYNAKKKKKK